MAVSLSLSVTKNSQNVANNTTNITVKVNAHCTYGSWSAEVRNGYVTIDGTKYTFSSAFNTGASTTWNGTLFTKQVDIGHNSDGTKSVSIYAWFSTGVSSGDISTSKTEPLTTISRESSITSVSDVTLGESCTIKFTPNSKNFKYALTCYVSAESSNSTNYRMYIISNIAPNKTTEHTITKTFDANDKDSNNVSWAQKMSNVTSIKGKWFLHTYDANNNQIGSTQSKEFTIKYSPSPSLTSLSTEIDGNGWDKTKGLYIQGKSKCKLTINGAVAGNGSTIKTYSIKGTGINATTSSETTNLLTTAGEITYTGTITDGRDLSASKTAKITVLAYAKPTITIDAIRDAGTPTTAKINYTVAFSSLSGQNSIPKIYYRYKTKNGSFSELTEWTSSELSDNTSGKYSGYFSIQDLSVDDSYVVEAYIKDSAYSTQSATVTTSISTSFKFVDIDLDNNVWAFGKTAEGSQRFECAMSADFSGSVNFDEDIIFENGEQSDHHLVRFKNESGEYTHNAHLYGGSPSSPTAIGMWDQKNGWRVITYNDVQNIVNIGSDASDIRLYGSIINLGVGATNIKINNNTLCDYVIEEQLNNTGYSYIKYANGIQVAWYKQASGLSKTINSAYGNVYYKDESWTMSSSIKWSAVPNCDISVRSLYGIIGTKIKELTLDTSGVLTIKFHLWSAKSETLSDIYYDVFLIGRWK